MKEIIPESVAKRGIRVKMGGWVISETRMPVGKSVINVVIAVKEIKKGKEGKKEELEGAISFYMKRWRSAAM